ncbi:MAG: SCO family protein [Gammaproteobacteria bacterium]|nr:SCO family protein [Gammaproteobacteria bacterium]
MKRHIVLVAAVAVVALVAGAVSAYFVSRPDVSDIPGLLWPKSKPLEPFALDDHDRRTFDLERLRGHWSMVFFGYTHCPDVCPVTLAVLKQVDGLLAGDDDLAPMQYVFVSVDPVRDSLDHLGKYVGHFDEAFLGVTGDDEALASLARQLGVLYVRGEPGANGDYLVDHTAAIFLVDPRGHLLAIFHAPHNPATLAGYLERIRPLVRD